MIHHFFLFSFVMSIFTVFYYNFHIILVFSQVCGAVFPEIGGRLSEGILSLVLPDFPQVFPYEDPLGFPNDREKNTEYLPVEGMRIKIKMAMGIGGITVATFANGKEAFIKDGSFFKCPDNHQSSNGECDTELTQLHLDTLENLCFLRPLKTVRKFTCLTMEAPLTFQENNNGEVICRSKKEFGSPVLLLSRSYDKLCSEFGHGKFVYYPDKKRNDSVELPHRNHFVTCLNGGSEDFCKFTF